MGRETIMKALEGVVVTNDTAKQIKQDCIDIICNNKLLSAKRD